MSSSDLHTDSRKVAEKDIRRLKWNWVFVALLCSMISVGYVSPLSTIHQFIINPTIEELNKTGHHKIIEPGLEQSETFYSWTFTVFFVGFTLSGILAGVLTNLIPYWYLFLLSSLAHVGGYVLYALATNGWMMILGRLLAGISMGSVTTLTFAYYGVSFEEFADNVRVLEEYEEMKAARMKGLVFSLYTVGKTVGQTLGAAFPIVLASFDVNHFRSVGWFNVAVGVALILLQVVMFHGEYKCSRSATLTLQLIIHHLTDAHDRSREFFFKSLIPTYIIIVGGIKGARYVVTEILVNPILSDSFGFTEAESSYFFLSYPVGQILGSTLVILLQYLKCSRFFLTVSGMMCTIAGLLIITDWQAIPHDPCTNYSLFHHPELINAYRKQAFGYSPDSSIIVADYLQPVDEKVQLTSDTYVQSDLWQWKSHNQTFRCRVTNTCELCNLQHEETCTRFVSTTNRRICLSQTDSGDTLDPGLMYSTLNESQQFLFCTLHHEEYNCSSCSLEPGNKDMQSTIQSFLPEAHAKALRLVRRPVYQIAVNQCESVDQCHWIPHSLVTHRHCNDCQPICRSTERTLNFIQFTVGINLLFATLPIMYTGTMLMLSNSVGRRYQGISFGCMITFMGIVRSTTPLWLYGAYEKVQKRTFLPMLILVGLFLPLLTGLLLLYPWIGDNSKRGETQKKEDEKEDSEGTELLHVNSVKHQSSDSE